MFIFIYNSVTRHVERFNDCLGSVARLSLPFSPSEMIFICLRPSGIIAMSIKAFRFQRFYPQQYALASRSGFAVSFRAIFENFCRRDSSMTPTVAPTKIR